MVNQSKSIVKNDYYLQSGSIVVTEKATHISTVVGSCVAVCIYDKERKTGGMNHFQLPFTHEKDRATARYGNVATCALIYMLINDGSQTQDLEAQIFGGAHNPEMAHRDIGRENIKIARKVLSKKQIRVVSEDVGGEKGRKIVFKTHANEIAVMRVGQLRKGDWHPYQSDR
jgi:chemotaxis protein CheD